MTTAPFRRTTRSSFNSFWMNCGSYFASKPTFQCYIHVTIKIEPTLRNRNGVGPPKLLECSAEARKKEIGSRSAARWCSRIRSLFPKVEFCPAAPGGDQSRTRLHNPYRSCRAQRAGPKPAYFTAFASEAPANCGHTHALKFSERVLGTIFTVGADVRRPESQGFQHGSEPPHVGSYNFKTRCQPATLRRSVGGVSPSARPFVSCFTFVPDPSLIGNIGVLIYRTSPRPNAELS